MTVRGRSDIKVIRGGSDKIFMGALDPGPFTRGFLDHDATPASEQRDTFFSSADLTRGAIVAVCLTDRESVYTSAVETIQVTHDGRTRSQVRVHVALPVEIFAQPEGGTVPVPVRFVAKKAPREGDSQVTVNGAPAALMSDRESARIMASAVLLMVSEVTRQHYGERLLSERLEETISSNAPTDPFHLLPELEATDRCASEWLRICMAYRIVLAALTADEVRARLVFSFQTTPPTIRTQAPRRLSVSRWQGELVCAASPIEMALAGDKHRDPPALPPGVRVRNWMPTTAVNLNNETMPAVALNLEHDRSGLQVLVLAAALVSAGILGALTWSPQLLAALCDHSDGASALLAVGPGILVSIVLRPDLGRQLGRLLRPVQLSALAVAVALGGSALLILCGLPADRLATAVFGLWGGTSSISLLLAADLVRRRLERGADHPHWRDWQLAEKAMVPPPTADSLTPARPPQPSPDIALRLKASIRGASSIVGVPAHRGR